MAYADVLKELARQVRRDTLRVLDGSQPDWLTWSPEGTSNHILWHAGHALWLQDLMCVELLSGQSELPAGWAAKFGAKSRPAAVEVWPSRDAVRRELIAQFDRMQELLDETTDEVLSETPLNFVNKRTILGWIVHGLHDEAKHNGEMYLLWKLCRSRA